MTFVTELWVGRKSLNYNARFEWLVLKAEKKNQVCDILADHFRKDQDVTNWTIDRLVEAGEVTP